MVFMRNSQLNTRFLYALQNSFLFRMASSALSSGLTLPGGGGGREREGEDGEGPGPVHRSRMKHRRAGNVRGTWPGHIRGGEAIEKGRSRERGLDGEEGAQRRSDEEY
jgi:hypothetical protein